MEPNKQIILAGGGRVLPSDAAATNSCAATTAAGHPRPESGADDGHVIFDAWATTAASNPPPPVAGWRRVARERPDAVALEIRVPLPKRRDIKRDGGVGAGL